MNNNNKLMFSIPTKSSLHHLARISAYPLHNELDVVAESIDKKHILVGECKWTHDEDADRLMDVLEQKAKYLPFIKKGQEVHLVLFLKESPTHCAKGMRVFLPNDVMKA